jgi:hypothetical protein
MNNDKLDDLDAKSAIALAFAKNSLPYSLLDDEYFKNALKAIQKESITLNKLKIR